MFGSRNLLGWLLVGLVGAVTAGGAILGVVQSPGTATLPQAIDNTLQAPSYSEVFTETLPVGSQTGYLTYQAPDRLGGYVLVGSHQRTYVYVQGHDEYQSITVQSGTASSHLVFYRQHVSSPISEIDPVKNYLRLGRGGHVVSKKGGNTYTEIVTRGGATGEVTYTVTGQYIGRFTIHAQQTTVVVTISQVGTAPAVGLPPGSHVVGVSGVPGLGSR